MMTQTDLLRIVTRMNNGQAIVLNRNQMLGCAKGMLLSGFDQPRQEDIDEFIQHASKNWSVLFIYDFMYDLWTMRKMKQDNTDLTENSMSCTK